MKTDKTKIFFFFKKRGIARARGKRLWRLSLHAPTKKQLQLSFQTCDPSVEIRELKGFV